MKVSQVLEFQERMHQLNQLMRTQTSLISLLPGIHKDACCVCLQLTSSHLGLHLWHV